MSTKKLSKANSTSENENSPTINDKSNQTSEDEINFQIEDDNWKFYWSNIDKNKTDLLSNNKLIKKIENKINKNKLLAGLK